MVSKYIGETAKHLAQIFARASRMNGVLLFDEADALFSKRTEVKDSHDRYANADTSYLLQLLEEYRGIVILATNKRQNIDPAFIRRVRYVFEFPRPDAAERGRIWRQVIGELSGDETLKRTRKDNRSTRGERRAIGRPDQERGAGLDLRRAAQPRAAGDDAFAKGYRARAGQGRSLGGNPRTRELDARWLSTQTPQSTSGS